MGENTKIQWTDHSFNPWVGCTKVAPGCKNCYAEAMQDTRLHRVSWGKNGTRRVTSATNWRKPLAWNREAGEGCSGDRPRVFCASLADVFEDWPGPMIRANTIDTTMDAARLQLFGLIYNTPNLDWLLLTKRPENIHPMWPCPCRSNVWLGTSVSDQETAEKVISCLLACRNLSPILFLSIEPLLGLVDLGPWIDLVDWVIVGGESGHNARPIKADWVRGIRDQCQNHGIPFFFKGWGHAKSRAIDGKTYSEFPKAVTRRRESKTI